MMGRMFKKGVTLLCINVLFYSQLWAAVSSLEEILPPKSSVRSTLEGGTLFNQDTLTLSSKDLHDLRSIENHGTLTIRAEEPVVSLPKTLLNRGAIRIESDHDVRVEAQSLENVGEIAFHGDHHWSLLFDHLQNQGALLGSGSLSLEGAEERDHTLEGVVLGMHVHLKNIQRSRAFIYAGYGTVEEGTFSYTYGGKSPEPFEGSVIARGGSTFSYAQALSPVLSAYLDAQNVSIRLKDGARFTWGRSQAKPPSFASFSNPPVSHEEFLEFKIILESLSIDQLLSFWPLMSFIPQGPSSMNNLSIRFNDGKKGYLSFAGDYNIFGKLEVFNAHEVHVDPNAHLYHGSDVFMDADIFRIDGAVLYQGDVTPVFQSMGRLIIGIGGSFKTGKYHYTGSDLWHKNEGIFYAEVLKGAFFLDNEGRAFIGMGDTLTARNKGRLHTSIYNVTLHAREGEFGALTANGARCVKVVLKKGNRLDHTIKARGDLYLSNKTARQTRVSGGLESGGSLVLKGENITVLKGAKLSAKKRVVLKSNTAQTLNGHLKAPQISLKGSSITGSGTLDTAFLNVEGVMDTSHFKWGDLESLDAKTGHNKAAKFTLGGEFPSAIRSLIVDGRARVSIRKELTSLMGIHVRGSEIRMGAPLLKGRRIFLLGPTSFHVSRKQEIKGADVSIETEKVPVNVIIKANNSAHIKSDHSLEVEGEIRSPHVTLVAQKHLTPRPNKVWKQVRLRAGGQTTVMGSLDTKDLMFETGSFVPLGDMKTSRGYGKAKSASLDHMRMGGEDVLMEIDEIRSRSLDAWGIAFKGKSHHATDLKGEHITVVGKRTILDGKTSVGSAAISGGCIVLEGSLEADTVSFPEKSEYLTLLGELVTKQKILKVVSDVMRLVGTLRSVGGGGESETPTELEESFDELSLKGRRGHFSLEARAEKLTSVFDENLSILNSVLKTGEAIIGAHMVELKNTALETKEKGLIGGHRVSIEGTSLKGGDIALKTGEETEEKLEGSVFLSRSTVDVDKISVTTGTLKADPKSFKAREGAFHLGYMEGGVRKSLKYAHDMDKVERVKMDVSRILEDLIIEGDEVWRSNIHMIVSMVKFLQGSSLESSGDLGLTGIKGVEGKHTTIKSGGSLSISSLRNIVLESLSKRQGDRHNYKDYKKAVSLRAAKDIELKAEGNIDLTSIEADAGGDTSFFAGGSIVDKALALVTQRTHFHKKGYSLDRWTHQNPSHYKAEGTISSLAGGEQHLYAPHMEAAEIAIHGGHAAHLHDVHNEYFHKSRHKKDGGWFKKSKTIEREILRIWSLGAKLRANKVTVSSKKDVSLTNPQIYASETTLRSLEGKVRLLLGRNYYRSFTSKQSSNIAWQSQSMRAEEHKTYSEGVFKGDLKVESKEVFVQQVKGKSLDFLEKLEGQKITKEFLEEFHKSECHKSDGPTAALAAVIAIGVTIATAGTGSSLGASLATSMGQATAATAAGTAATFTTTGAVIQGMTAAAFTTLCSQSAVALVANKGDIGKTVRHMTSTQMMKSVGKAMLSGGITRGVGHSLGIQELAEGASFMERLKHHAMTEGIRSGAGLVSDAVAGRDMGESLKSSALSFGVSVLGASLAGEIGDAYAKNKSINPFEHKILHTLVGALGGGALGGEKGALAGAVGALVAETCADLFSSDKEGVLDAKIKALEKEKGRALTEGEFKGIFREEINKVADWSKFAGVMGAFLTDLDPDIAHKMGANAIDNNFLVNVLSDDAMTAEEWEDYIRGQEEFRKHYRKIRQSLLDKMGKGKVVGDFIIADSPEMLMFQILTLGLGYSAVVGGARAIDKVNKAYRASSLRKMNDFLWNAEAGERWRNLLSIALRKTKDVSLSNLGSLSNLSLASAIPNAGGRFSPLLLLSMLPALHHPHTPLRITDSPSRKITWGSGNFYRKSKDGKGKKRKGKDPHKDSGGGNGEGPDPSNPLIKGTLAAALAKSFHKKPMPNPKGNLGNTGKTGRLVPKDAKPPKGVKFEKPGKKLSNGDYIDPRKFSHRIKGSNQEYANDKGWVLSKEKAYNSGSGPHGKGAWKLRPPGAKKHICEVAIDGKIFRQ